MKRMLLVLSALILSGCVSLLPEAPPPPRVFALEAVDVAPLEGDALAVVVAVADPDGESAIRGTELVWRNGAELAYVAQTRWSERADDLLQAMVIDTLSAQGQVRAAVRPGAARADVLLSWTLRDFEIVESGGAYEARFAAHVMLIDRANRAILGVRDIATSAPVASRSASQAAQGLARAAQEGGARIGQFTVETLRDRSGSAL